MTRRLACAALLWVLATASFGADFEHAGWTALLARHVAWNAAGTASTVDYAGFRRDRDALRSYLDRLAAVDRKTFSAWPETDRHAFLLNAYNAFTIELILTRYPDLGSIKELGGLLTSPWKKRFFKLLGEPRSLDDVEHGLLRGAPDFDEPRIHFAANCASIGCPALRPEAYVGTTLDAQLEDQARRFLRDRSRNRISAKGDAVEVSAIFDWYEDDFARAGGVGGFLADRGEALGASAAQQRALRAGELEIRALPYDWRLNAAMPRATP